MDRMTYVKTLRAELAHMTEARDAARAEVERLTAKLNAIEADDDKLSIMFGWLVYDVGEHTCGGYGPESGYAHEPGCGFEPVLRLDKLEGWPGEKPLDADAERQDAPEPPPADRSWLTTERIHARPGASCQTCRDTQRGRPL